jgi:hypothetical protein
MLASFSAAASAQDATEPAMDDAAGANVEHTDAPAKAPARPRAVVRREAEPTLSPPTPTPEMWLYEQELKRHDDPKLAVRRAAEYRATQRQRRIESRKWFGLSNSRPVASPNPWYETYSPMWTGNTAFPYEWSGAGGPAVAYRPGWYGTNY